MIKTEADLNRPRSMREAIDAALCELGEPGPEYPAPVANAVKILRSAKRVGEVRTIDFVCATPPGPDSDFVEVESPPGTGFALGNWLQRDDRYWVLRFRAAIEEQPEAPARPELPTHPETPEASRLLADVVSGAIPLERDPVFPRYLYIPTLIDPKVPRGFSIIARNVAELDHYAPHLPQAERDLLVSILQSVDGKAIPFVRLYGVGVSGNPADYPEHVSAMVIETSERLEREGKC